MARRRCLDIDSGPDISEQRAISGFKAADQILRKNDDGDDVYYFCLAMQMVADSLLSISFCPRIELLVQSVFHRSTSSIDARYHHKP